MEEKSVPSDTLGMDKYINRKDAIYAAKHAWAKGIEPSQYIEIIPAADVALVRKGRWLSWEEAFQKTPKRKNNLGVFCDKCHKHNDNRTDYCPNCGAKMGGGIKTDG